MSNQSKMNMENEFVKNYLDAYKAMKDRATEVIKNYGKTLEVQEILKTRLMKEKGWTEWPAYGSEEAESVEQEVEDWKYEEMFWCGFEDKHGSIHGGYIPMVRWNAAREEIEVYFESGDGFISQWLSEHYIGFDNDAIYQTILEFID